MRNEEILASICHEIEKLKEENLNDFTAEHFRGAGAIFYMNANDGTGFDFYVNQHTCEFGVLYAEGYYAIKAYLNNDGYLCAYVFSDGPVMSYSSFEQRKKICSGEEAQSFAGWLEREFDEKEKLDSIIWPKEENADTEVKE